MQALGFVLRWCLLPFIFSLTFVDYADAQASRHFDYGKYKNGIYKNAFFKMQVDVPADWYVASKEQMAQLYETGKNLAAGDDEMLQRTIEAVDVNTAFLFSVFKYELGAPVKFNPGVLVVAENTKNYPGIRDGRDYLYHAQKLLERTQMGYQFNEEVPVVNMDGQLFYKLSSTLEPQAGIDIVLYQEYFSTVVKGFTLSFIVTYADNDQREEVYRFLNGVDFKN